jgi:hypothetical protein
MLYGRIWDDLYLYHLRTFDEAYTMTGDTDVTKCTPEVSTCLIRKSPLSKFEVNVSAGVVQSGY